MVFKRVCDFSSSAIVMVPLNIVATTADYIETSVCHFHIIINLFYRYVFITCKVSKLFDQKLVWTTRCESLFSCQALDKETWHISLTLNLSLTCILSIILYTSFQVQIIDLYSLKMILTDGSDLLFTISDFLIHGSTLRIPIFKILSMS
jgi:hypothetical protein